MTTNLIKLPCWLALGISLAFAIITVYYHQFIYLSQPNVTLVVKDHFEVVNGKAMAPIQYRPAPYMIAHLFFMLLTSLGAPNDSNTLLRVYVAINLLIMTACFYLILTFFQRWFNGVLALLGLCFMVAVNPLAEYQYYHQPGDSWNLLFFLIAYHCLAASKDFWLIPILLVGTPFRETIGLLIPAYAALRWKNIPNSRLLTWLIIFIVVFLIPYVMIRFNYGVLPNYITTRLDWEVDKNAFFYNITHIDGWIVLFLYFNVLWIAVVLEWSQMPNFLRRLFVIVPLLLCSSLFWGRIVEARLYLPIMPLFIPAGLLFLQNKLNPNTQCEIKAV